MIKILAPALVALGSCAVLQPDEFTLGYAHGFGTYEHDAWNGDISAVEDTVSTSFTWYVGTTMPPERARLVQPRFIPEPEPPVSTASVPDPVALSTGGVAPVQHPDPHPAQPISDSSVWIYQLGTMAGAALIAYQNRKMMSNKSDAA